VLKSGISKIVGEKRENCVILERSILVDEDVLLLHFSCCTSVLRISNVRQWSTSGGVKIDRDDDVGHNNT
jgi:hypothetical protein